MMKNLFLIFLVIFYSCGSNPENKSTVSEEDIISSEDLELHGNYHLQKVGSRNLASEDIFLKFDRLQNEVSGYAGCNRFSSSFVLTGKNISFKEPVSTEMYCAGKMEIEQAIMNSLKEVSAVLKQGENYVLVSEANEPLLILEKTKKSE